MKTLIIIILLILCSGCTSAYMVNMGYGDPVKWAGNRCVEMGYERDTDEWRECIFRLRGERETIVIQ